MPDTLIALQDLGREVRRRSGARVVAITGSAGKTTTKELTADLLATRFRVYRNRGNLNNHIGLPLSLTELVDAPDVAVVELGMNHAGEIRTLVGIAEPDLRVWINVGDAHIGHFGSRDAVAAAKAEILEGATATDVVVANADDALVMSHVHRAAGRVITFGMRNDATVRASDIVDRGFDGNDGRGRDAGRRAAPRGGAARARAAHERARCRRRGDRVRRARAARLKRGSQDCTPCARRGAMTTTASGRRLVDDSYNASPAAVRAMLDALRATPTEGRRIAALGEMLELGDLRVALHAECGRAAVAAGVDELFVVGGPAADGFATGAIEAGLAASHVYRFSESASAGDAIARLVRPGDLVVVKGSRGTRMDVIADRLADGGGA